jgi:ribosomal protein S10
MDAYVASMVIGFYTLDSGAQQDTRKQFEHFMYAHAVHITQHTEDVLMRIMASKANVDVRQAAENAILAFAKFVRELM